jgi:hypothetical protein
MVPVIVKPGTVRRDLATSDRPTGAGQAQSLPDRLDGGGLTGILSP